MSGNTSKSVSSSRSKRPISLGGGSLSASPVGGISANRVPSPSVRRSPPSGDLVQSSFAPNYSGVVRLLSGDRRLIVNGKGNRYQLQTLGEFEGVPCWRGQFLFATKSALLLKFSADVGLAVALADLPEKPGLLCPDLVHDRARQRDAFKLNDTGRDAYARVVAQVDDWRLVVDPDGSTYRLMFVHLEAYSGGSCGWNMWVSSFAHSELSCITLQISRSGVDRFGTFSELWASTPCKLLPALADLPALAADGLWPDLPARPVSVARQSGLRRSRRV